MSDNINAEMCSVEQHLEAIPERHREGFLKLTAAGKDPKTVRAGIEYVLDATQEKTICERFDVGPQEVMDTALDVLEFTDVESGLEEYNDPDLFDTVFNLDYQTRRKMAELAPTDEIGGKSTQLEVATWYANNYNQDVVLTLSDILREQQ